MYRLFQIGSDGRARLSSMEEHLDDRDASARKLFRYLHQFLKHRVPQRIPCKADPGFEGQDRLNLMEKRTRARPKSIDEKIISIDISCRS